jgi:hypothetical protein
MLDNPSRRLRHIEIRMREQGHKTPHGSQYSGRLLDRLGGISHVIVDAELLLCLSLLRSNDGRRRDIHARNLSSLPRQLTGERAISTAPIEHTPSCKGTQHLEEGWMKQSPMPVAGLVSFVFIPTFSHVLPTICGRHVNPPSYSSHMLRAMQFVPKHEIDRPRHTQSGPYVVKFQGFP